MRCNVRPSEMTRRSNSYGDKKKLRTAITKKLTQKLFEKHHPDKTRDLTDDELVDMLNFFNENTL